MTPTVTPTAVMVVIATLFILAGTWAYSIHVKKGSVPAFITACATAVVGIVLVAIATVYELTGVTF